MRNHKILAVACLMLCLSIGMQAREETKRPKIGLVLGGGGAKGAAHAGALQIIEEVGIPIGVLWILCGWVDVGVLKQAQPETVEKAETDIKENSNVSDRSPVPKEHEGRTKLRKSTDK